MHLLHFRQEDHEGATAADCGNRLTLPLTGRTVVVTRSRHQAAELVDLLEASGANAISFPTIKIEPPGDPEPLHEALRGGSYDWIVVTSTNAVAALDEARRACGLERPAWPGATTRFCAVGPSTAAALEDLGIRADVIPEEYVGESILAALAEADAQLAGRRILIPRAAKARDVVPDGLRAAGASVEVVEAYRTVPVEGGAEATRWLTERLVSGEVDAVTFTSSSTVWSFHTIFGSELGGALVATIGPATSATASEVGYEAEVEAEEYTITGLVRALESHFAEHATE